MCVCSSGKGENELFCQVPLAGTGDPIFLQRLLVKLVWRRGLARTKLSGFGSYCSEKNPPKPTFFVQVHKLCVQVLPVWHLPELLNCNVSRSDTEKGKMV